MKIIHAIFFLILATSLLAEDQLKSRPAVLKAEDKIAIMRLVQTRLYADLEAANKEDDIRKINCLNRKKNLVDGLIKASERARLSLLEASTSQDEPTVQSYIKKIQTYGDSIDEISKSVFECSATNISPEERTTIAYISPEDEPEYITDQKSPWDPDGVLVGGEGYPVVPAASPFR